MGELSKPFVDMAALIDLNNTDNYGGSFVIMPPGEDAKPSVMLILDNSGDAATFWGSVMTRVQIALEELKQAEDKSGGFGGMRR
jgi:hypothetical protein